MAGGAGRQATEAGMAGSAPPSPPPPPPPSPPTHLRLASSELSIHLTIMVSFIPGHTCTSSRPRMALAASSLLAIVITPEPCTRQRFVE